MSASNLALWRLGMAIYMQTGALSTTWPWLKTVCAIAACAWLVAAGVAFMRADGEGRR